jgi:plastocyanin
MMYRYGMLALVAAVALGCGGSNNNGGGGTPTSPTNPPPTNNPPVATTTITITASGVNPQRITVSPGTRVTFINNDNRNHEINSDPHPTHGECPAIDDIGFMSPGQTKQTGNLTVSRTCGFHEHNLFPAPQYTGQIIVQ